MSSDSASSRRAGLSRGRFLASLAAVSLVRPGSLRGEGPGVVTDDRIRQDGGPLRVALLADCQFADADTPKGSDRRYLRSPQKLADAVAALAAERPHFAVHLGDLIDRDFRSFGVTLPVFEKFACPRFHVPGNHDYSVADAEKDKVEPLLGVPAPGWRDLTVGRFRFLFLNSNIESTFRRAKDAPESVAARGAMERRRASPAHAKFANEWNGGLGEAQRAWLRDRLARAASRDEKAVIFCHQPVVMEDAHSLWDTPETLALLADFPGVVAWINGHNHAGSYSRVGATHFLNLKGMVETFDNTYALATFHDDRIEIRGYGREPSRTLRF